MKNSPRFSMVVNLLMNFIMGLIVSLAVFLSSGIPIAADALVPAWLSSFVLGYTAGDIVPIASLSVRAGNFVSRGQSLLSHIIQSVILGAYFGTIILMGNAIINTMAAGGLKASLGFFADKFVLVILVAIASVFVLLRPIVRASSALCGVGTETIQSSNKETERD